MDYIILLLVTVSLALFYGNIHWKNPLVAVMNRWFRCFLVSVSLSVIFLELEWSAKPLWVLTFSFTLLWFFIESVYSWLGIRTMNFSPFNIFPGYELDKNSVWPKNKYYIKLKNWFSSNNFVDQVYVKAALFESLYIYSSFIYDKLKTTRVHVVFVPQKGGRYTHYFVLTSISKDGDVIITENAPIPFGGYYPEKWVAYRKPLVRSIGKLYKIHLRNTQGHELEAWNPETALQDMNKEQKLLEDINYRFGFLVPRTHQDLFGKISYEGRYRIWIEIWLIKYLGRTLQG